MGDECHDSPIIMLHYNLAETFVQNKVKLIQVSSYLLSDTSNLIPKLTKFDKN